MSQPPRSGAVLLDEESLNELFGALARRGYRLVGPVVRQRAIVLGELTSPHDLPRGWSEERSEGASRLARRGDTALFGFTVGAQSWKKYLAPPETRLWHADRTRGGFEIRSEAHDEPPYAMIGVRPCELHAIAIQDRVFLEGPFTDPSYARRRAEAFVVAVNCAEPGGTCFCASMGTGPVANSGFDLALTEVPEAGRHVYVGESGSERGAGILAEVPHRQATPAETDKTRKIHSRACERMGRSLETEGLEELLDAKLEHPHWNDVAGRCLTCGNCTLVCPTCFCNTVEDVTDIGGERAERWRRWDTCFTGDFSYIHGGRVRQSSGSRYRQWMTHKLSTWVDQFGRSGCVGCGRCITWCPVGIDITEEARALRNVGPTGRASTRG